MKNALLLTAVLALAGTFAACTVSFPWDIMDDYDGVRVVMRVTPDDADVMLNGRYIGAAYEYASSRLALRLASRQNELEFRKKGFRSKVVDLRDFPGSRINLTVNLEAERPETTADTPPAPEDRRPDEAQSELPLQQPAEKPAPANARFLTLVQLTVTPEETAVYIDNRFWGLSPAVGKTMFLRLPPGKYLFTAFKPGYAAFNREIVVPRQEKFALEITLRK